LSLRNLDEKKIKVSVIIAAYNSEKYIDYAIQSIKKQEYKNWELIIVNDCSTDLTKKIIEKYKSKKIKIINLKKNIGSYKATNLAFRKITGKYIAILDSDDYSHPKRIISQVIELEKNPKVGLVFTKYRCIDEKNKIIKDIKKKESISDSDFNVIFPCQNLVCNSSAMFRRNFINELIFYNKDFVYSCDYNFYLKIFKVSKVKCINKFYTFYRIHFNQSTQSIKLKKIIYNENLKHLEWSKANGFINKKNIYLYYKNYLINYFKLLLNY
jgi:glycosyltransferase involved in cell wall biosynthesis